MAETRSNLVTFTADDDGRPMFLTLLEPFVITAGVRPNFTQAKVPWSEFLKLKGPPRQRGTLAFWFSFAPGAGDPDVVYKGMRIVEVRASEVKVPRGQLVPRVTEYVLTIADFRERLLPPRGGRVNLGLVNPTLKELAAGDAEPDATPPTPGQPAPPQPIRPVAAVKRTNAELLRYVFEQLLPKRGDNPGYELPAASEINAVEAARDLQWYGNFAADEAAKLLDRTHLVLCPSRQGKAIVYKTGSGNVPRVPATRKVYDLAMPETDVRGARVIFTSAPNAIVETVELRGPSATTWEFVIRNEKGQWTEINDKALKTILPDGPAQTVRQQFSKVPVLYRDNVRAELYRCIRLNQKTYPPLVRRMLRRRVIEDLTLADLDVRANRAVQNPATGIWLNSNEPVPCNIALVVQGQGVIVTHERLGKIDRPTEVTEWETRFQTLSASDLVVKLTMEAAIEVQPFGQDQQQSKVKVPEYYAIGFRRIGANVTQLSASEVEAQQKDPADDTTFVAQPELRLVRTFTWGNNKPTTNEADLKKQAKTLAEHYLAGPASRAPREIRVSGFYGVDLDGVVGEVRIDQERVETTIKLNPWFTPMSGGSLRGLAGAGGGGGGGAGGAYPGQAGTLAQGLELGTAGAAQPVVPIASAPPPVFADSFIARIVGSGELPDLDADIEGLIGAHQWLYRIVEVRKAKAGHNGWASMPGGREGEALNWAEAPNRASGLQGNGVDTDNLTGTGLKLQPAPSGVLVRVFAVHVPAIPADDKADPPKPEVPAKTEYWFGYENGIDGSCTP